MKLIKVKTRKKRNEIILKCKSEVFDHTINLKRKIDFVLHFNEILVASPLHM